MNTFEQRIAEKRRVSEENRRKIVTVARSVGRVIAKAGYQKATRYKVWGRDVDGYEVNSGYEAVYVAMTVDGDEGFQILSNIQQTLEEAGYIVTREAQPPVNGIVSDIRVEVPGLEATR